MRRTISALLTVLTLIPFAYAQTYTTDQVLAKMDGNSRSFKSLQASMQRADFNNLVKKTENSSGKLYVDSRGAAPRFKMETTEPKKGQIALIEMGRISIYDPQLNTLTERNLAGREDMLQLFMMGFGVSSDKIRKSYSIAAKGQESVEGKPVTVLELTATQKDARFPKIRLWISNKDWNAVQIELTEVTKDTHLIKYKDVKLNQSISNSVFKLNVPKDVIKAG